MAKLWKKLMNTILEIFRKIAYTRQRMRAEVDRRMATGWQRFGQHSNFVNDSKIPICLKRKIMNTVILPALTYGAETCTPTKHQEKKLAVAQRSMERSLLNITRRDRIRNEDVRKRSGVRDIIEKANIMKGVMGGTHSQNGLQLGQENI